MAIDIVAVGSGWHVVDTSVPGWRTLERHSQKARAEAAVERLRGQTGEVIEAESGETLEGLARLLDGKVALVRSRIAEVETLGALDVLEELEASVTRRVTVLRAISARRAELMDI
jgi:hypothetical protein